MVNAVLLLDINLKISTNYVDCVGSLTTSLVLLYRWAAFGKRWCFLHFRHFTLGNVYKVLSFLPKGMMIGEI